jgi:hypothetical protein
MACWLKTGYDFFERAFKALIGGAWLLVHTVEN